MTTIESHDASRQDMTRHDAPQDLTKFSLSVDDVLVKLQDANVPKSRRTVVRYCESASLDCFKSKTNKTTKYFITPASVEILIGELQRLPGADDTTRHDASRHVMTSADALENAQQSGEREARHHETRHAITSTDLSENTNNAGDDTARHDAPRLVTSREIELLEKIITEKDARIADHAEQILHLKTQLDTKDRQIETLFIEQREGRSFTGSLGALLSRLLPGGSSSPDHKQVGE